MQLNFDVEADVAVEVDLVVEVEFDATVDVAVAVELEGEVDDGQASRGE